MTIHGTCDARFEPVRAEFQRNFAERGEVGATVCVLVDGVSVVDLWGGIADRRTGRPWERDSIGVVWSCTKGAVALCAHLLVARGELDLDAPVARYWPEFAQQGKEAITLRLLLSHQAGLPAVRQPLRPGGVYDWDYMTAAIAAEAPFWEPGTRQGYHAVTFGHLIGEVVRRVSGKDLGAFFRDEVAGPLGLDFHLGLSERDEERVAPHHPRRPAPSQRGTVALSHPGRRRSAQPTDADRAQQRPTACRPGQPGGTCGTAAQPGRHHQCPGPGRDVRAVGSGRAEEWRSTPERGRAGRDAGGELGHSGRCGAAGGVALRTGLHENRRTIVERRQGRATA